MSANTRLRVLKCFRQLHRTKLKVFKDDVHAIGYIGGRINEEFRKGASETDPDKIEELIKVAEDSDMLLRKTVIQGRLVDDNKYRYTITEDTHMEDNYPFDPNAKLPEIPKRGKRARKTCEEIQKELDSSKPS